MDDEWMDGWMMNGWMDGWMDEELRTLIRMELGENNIGECQKATKGQ